MLMSSDVVQKHFKILIKRGKKRGKASETVKEVRFVISVTRFNGPNPEDDAIS
jgi:hypothetical protein